MTSSIFVMNPTAASRNEQAAQPRALDGLQGKVVGFIDNSKPNFSELVDDLAELLIRDYGVQTVVKRRKGSPSLPAPAAVAQELYDQCDIVIAGSGD